MTRTVVRISLDVIVERAGDSAVINAYLVGDPEKRSLMPLPERVMGQISEALDEIDEVAERREMLQNHHNNNLSKILGG